jgi:sugar/nucleoside kinase (ribokinase family)
MGSFSMKSLQDECIDLSSVVRVEGVMNQFAFILVDAATGERTIIWKRDERLGMQPEEVPGEAVLQGRFLLLDGHDAQAAAQAARLTRGSDTRVVVDAETVKPGTEDLIHTSDFVVASSRFPQAFTDETNLETAMKAIYRQGPRCVVTTLGKEGALCLCETGWVRSAGFKIKCVDSTGAGDVFHGAFIFGLCRGWAMERILDFANAAAAINCTAIGARGGIKPVEAIFDLIETGERW